MKASAKAAAMAKAKVAHLAGATVFYSVAYLVRRQVGDWVAQ